MQQNKDYKKRIDFSIPVTIMKERGFFIAYSPALDLATSAKDFKEARKRFEEIVGIFFDSIIEKGTIEEVLLDLGWTKMKRTFKPPVVVSNEMQQVVLNSNYGY